MNDLFSLAGKNVLITGSAQGIGYLLATGLGKYGAQIIVNDINQERADAAVEKLRAADIRAVAAPFNVTKKQKLMPLSRALRSKPGRLMSWSIMPVSSAAIRLMTSRNKSGTT